MTSTLKSPFVSGVGGAKLAKKAFPKIIEPETEVPLVPSPTPEPIRGREEEEAKKKVRKRRRGRAANILAGRLTSQRNDILKVQLG